MAVATLTAAELADNRSTDALTGRLQDAADELMAAIDDLIGWPVLIENGGE